MEDDNVNENDNINYHELVMNLRQKYKKNNLVVKLALQSSVFVYNMLL